MKTKVFLRFTGIFLILVSIGLIFINPKLFIFFQQHFSTDNSIAPLTILVIDFHYYLVTMLLVVLGGLLLSGRSIRLFPIFRRSLLADPICQFVRPSTWLISSLIIGFIWSCLYILNTFVLQGKIAFLDLLYEVDGFFEKLTVVISLVGCIFMILAIIALMKKSDKSRLSKVICGAYVVLTLAFFLFAMEELNWGQSLFHWKASGLFLGNHENETNLHNFLTYGTMLGPLEAIFGIFIMFIVSISMWLEYKEKHTTFSRLMFPHPSLIGLAAIMSFLGWNGELLEELFAFFILFYSMRVLMCVKSSLKEF